MEEFYSKKSSSPHSLFLALDEGIFNELSSSLLMTDIVAEDKYMYVK